MARVTIKELQEKLKKRDETIEWQQQKIQELQEHNEEILNNKDCVSKAEYEALLKQLENLQSSHKTLKELYEHWKEKSSKLINKCTELREEVDHKTEMINIFSDNYSKQKELVKEMITGETVPKVEYDGVLARNAKLEKLVDILKKQNSTQIKNETKHNARGAGRKSTLTDEQLEKVQQLHKQGLSYGAIAKEVGFSKAYVYKLINKQQEGLQERKNGQDI